MCVCVTVYVCVCARASCVTVVGDTVLSVPQDQGWTAAVLR